MKNCSMRYFSRFNIIIIVLLVIATIISIYLSFFSPLFVLNENQLLYLFSAMAQIIGGVFGLTLTAYVFFVDKFKESSKGDDTYYDATVALLNRYFHNLIMIAVVCGMTIVLCIAGIILLYNWMEIYSFIINESVFLFIIGVTIILVFGTILLDPAKLDKEIAKLKEKAEKYYHSTSSTIAGDFSDFLKSYNLLERIIIDFSEECMEKQTTYSSHYNPRIIQSLNILVNNEIINTSLQDELNELRMYRNALVHGIDFSVSQEVCDRVSKIYQALYEALKIYKNSGRGSDEYDMAIRKIYDLTR